MGDTKTVGFWRYRWMVFKASLPEASKLTMGLILTLLLAAGSVFLQTQWDFFPTKQQWLRYVAAIAGPCACFGIYLFIHMARAQWLFYVDKEKEIASLTEKIDASKANI